MNTSVLAQDASSPKKTMPLPHSDHLKVHAISFDPEKAACYVWAEDGLDQSLWGVSSADIERINIVPKYETPYFRQALSEDVVAPALTDKIGYITSDTLMKLIALMHDLLSKKDKNLESIVQLTHADIRKLLGIS